MFKTLFKIFFLFIGCNCKNFTIFTSKFLPKKIFGRIISIYMETIDNQIFRFCKFHGAGNDFVIVNAKHTPFVASDEEIFEICHRRTGIGADGLIVVLPSESYDFRMKYYNCDGHESTFCGNGGRCVAAFAYEQGLANEKMIYEAIDGIHEASVCKKNHNEYIVSLTMRDIDTYKIDDNTLIINTGSPHYVTRVKNLKDYDVVKNGAAIRYDKSISADGVNVDFMELVDGQYFIRTYERGVEDETLACGTGVTASAIAAALWNGGNDINIKTTIATLNVKFKINGNNINDIVLTGPATLVYDGTYIFNR